MKKEIKAAKWGTPKKIKIKNYQKYTGKGLCNSEIIWALIKDSAS
jgi:hypothetical protein